MHWVDPDYLPETSSVVRIAVSEIGVFAAEMHPGGKPPQ